MGNKNYSKFSQVFKKPEQHNHEKMIEQNNQILEEVHNEIIDEIVNQPVTTEFADGVVSGCIKLYVRMKPSKDSDHVAIIDKGTKVVVNLTESTTDDFYKVYITSGVEGYCMKKFISIE